jgi:hypothetical protein
VLERCDRYGLARKHLDVIAALFQIIFFDSVPGQTTPNEHIQMLVVDEQKKMTWQLVTAF